MLSALSVGQYPTSTYAEVQPLQRELHLLHGLLTPLPGSCVLWAKHFYQASRAVLFQILTQKMIAFVWCSHSCREPGNQHLHWIPQLGHFYVLISGAAPSHSEHRLLSYTTSFKVKDHISIYSPGAPSTVVCTKNYCLDRKEGILNRESTTKVAHQNDPTVK